jgi:small subunit ribosomal protein S3
LGQKVHPTGFRLGYTKTWNSNWFREKGYSEWLHEDLHLKKYLKERLYRTGVAKILVERQANVVKVHVHTARPGIVIGKKGQEAEKLKKDLQKLAGTEVDLKIQEVRKPEINAQLVAENIAMQLERRIGFRRAMKKAVSTGLRFGAKGIKVMVAGRLGGAEMSRTEWYREGRVPLQTLRADIEYGFATARTTYGAIGVKTWIYHGDILG